MHRLLSDAIGRGAHRWAAFRTLANRYDTKPIRSDRQRHPVVIACLMAPTLCLATVGHAGFTSIEDLGNFPDAIEVAAAYDTWTNRIVNGVDISGRTGFIFTVENTSFGTPADPASAFRQDPDGDFANDDVLTDAAAAAIGARQPFGIFEFGTNMHPSIAADLDNGTLLAIMPLGFLLNVELLGPDPEVNFVLNDHTSGDGLLFDADALYIPSVFSNSRTGTLEFFIETNLPIDTILDFTSDSINERSLDIMTSMAWDEGGFVTDVFIAPGLSFDDETLRPRGELIMIPGPSSVAVLMLAGLMRPVRRRKR